VLRSEKDLECLKGADICVLEPPSTPIADAVRLIVREEIELPPVP
jgi:hypothetical protein